MRGAVWYPSFVWGGVGDCLLKGEDQSKEGGWISLTFNKSLILLDLHGYVDICIRPTEKRVLDQYQPEYQAGYQPEGRACRAARRLIPSLIFF